MISSPYIVVQLSLSAFRYFLRYEISDEIFWCRVSSKIFTFKYPQWSNPGTRKYLSIILFLLFTQCRTHTWSRVVSDLGFKMAFKLRSWDRRRHLQYSMRFLHIRLGKLAILVFFHYILKNFLFPPLFDTNLGNFFRRLRQ